MRVLLVEDDATLAGLIRRRLEEDGLLVDWVASRCDAEAAARAFPYALVLLDRGLPEGEGLQLLPALRAAPARPRVLVLTARSAPGERVAGLDAGADDYLAKPFDADELAARCRALLRRDGGGGPVLIAGGLRLFPGRRELSLHEKPLVLPRREFLILECLALSRGRVVTRERLFDHVYGLDDSVESNGLDANVSRLRRSLRLAGADVEVHAVRGIGYVLAVMAAQVPAP
jgi:two-component system, OmpR family, response regulator